LPIETAPTITVSHGLQEVEDPECAVQSAIPISKRRLKQNPGGHASFVVGALGFVYKIGSDMRRADVDDARRYG
jgi:hypothetical protein